MLLFNITILKLYLKESLEVLMNYPIQALESLKLFIRAFRKQKGVTQADMAEKLGISQQAYARFEGNPQLATLERLFLVLRILDVKISLEQIIKNSKEARSNMESESKEIW